MMIRFKSLTIVPPRYGAPDTVELLALDDEGRLWHRYSNSTGGWGPWQLQDDNPTL